MVFIGADLGNVIFNLIIALLNLNMLSRILHYYYLVWNFSLELVYKKKTNLSILKIIKKAIINYLENL